MPNALCICIVSPSASMQYPTISSTHKLPCVFPRTGLGTWATVSESQRACASSKHHVELKRPDPVANELIPTVIRRASGRTSTRHKALLEGHAKALAPSNTQHHGPLIQDRPWQATFLKWSRCAGRQDAAQTVLDAISTLGWPYQTC